MWRNQLVNSIFWGTEAEAILKIPLASGNEVDKWGLAEFRSARGMEASNSEGDSRSRWKPTITDRRHGVGMVVHAELLAAQLAIELAKILHVDVVVLERDALQIYGELDV
ncbi:hypothetical protein ACH5RR_006216 [Cinchona calisaya]|uniref:RNase H type-1 domain-containing protein n=1 Tax=Cinchona calisaya TaxID=153742 RepID=A0ABD3AND2_9GENT